jgi:Ca2+-binding RTX toxin-like protein
VQIIFADGTALDRAAILVRLPSAGPAEGTDGDDTLIGASCVDNINGLAASDILKGSVGADMLDGGTGETRLTTPRKRRRWS